MKEQTQITGREVFVIQKALAYAIAAIDRLPERQQESSDKEDMRRLFEALCSDEAARLDLLDRARDHLRPWDRRLLDFPRDARDGREATDSPE